MTNEERARALAKSRERAVLVANDWHNSTDQIIAYPHMMSLYDAIATAIEEARRDEQSWITCSYCGHKVKKEDGKFPVAMAEHVLSCEKSPLVKFWKQAEAERDRFVQVLTAVRAELRQLSENCKKLHEQRNHLLAVCKELSEYTIESDRMREKLLEAIRQTEPEFKLNEERNK